MASTKLEALKKKHLEEAARIRALEAKEAIRQRKAETRKKILVGAYLLHKTQKEGNFDALVAELDKFLIRKNDRTLFNLTPLETSDENVPFAEG